MPIRGFFSDSHLTLASPRANTAPSAVPYVTASVYLTALDRSVQVTFLIDTGADATIIHPVDSLRMLSTAEIRRLGPPVRFGGAGGGKNHYPTPAVVEFTQHNNTLKTIELERLYVAEPASHNRQIESLLGRDVLDHFIMTFDQNTRTVTLGS